MLAFVISVMMMQVGGIPSPYGYFGIFAWGTWMLTQFGQQVARRLNARDRWPQRGQARPYPCAVVASDLASPPGWTWPKGAKAQVGQGTIWIKKMIKT